MALCRISGRALDGIDAVQEGLARHIQQAIHAGLDRKALLDAHGLGRALPAQRATSVGPCSVHAATAAGSPLGFSRNGGPEDAQDVLASVVYEHRADRAQDSRLAPLQRRGKCRQLPVAEETVGQVSFPRDRASKSARPPFACCA